MPTTDDAITVTRRRDGNPATVYPGIATDLDVGERRQSIATEKRCDNQLRTKANDDICGGGERIKAAGHPSDGDGNGNGNSNGNGNGNHWVAGGVTSGGSGNGILLWRITR
jgi:hypothetical protein